MGIWEDYYSRTTALGSTKREVILNREKRNLKNKLQDNLSYHTVMIDEDAMGINEVEQNVVIIDSDNMNEKYIYSLPDESLTVGSLISWANNKWIITALDVNAELRVKAMMLQCNYLLKWKDMNGDIQEQWVIVEDSTKYMTGEEEDRNIVITRPDARISITLTRNARTALLGRENRFIIDDPLHSDKMVFQLSKPLRAGKTYNEKGIYVFVLTEVASSQYDNMELGIADYYKPNYKENTDHKSAIDGGRWI